MSTSKEAFLLHLHKRNPTSMDMMDRMVQKSDSETSHFVGIIWCSSLRKAVFMSYLNVFSKFHGNPFHRCWVVLVWTKAVGQSAESFGFRGEQEFLPGANKLTVYRISFCCFDASFFLYLKSECHLRCVGLPELCWQVHVPHQTPGTSLSQLVPPL